MNRSLRVLILALTWLPLAANASDTAPPQQTEPIYRVTVDKDDPIIGPAVAPVTMVVFSDYECGYCRRLESTLTALREKYKDDLRIVHKHNPLAKHRSAAPAAKIAICAHAQYQFAAMHAALNDTTFDDDELGLATSLGKRIGLDLNQLRICLHDPKTQAKLDADLDLGGAVTVRGTPTSFINGIKLGGARRLDDFIEVIDDALLSAKDALAKGKTLDTYYDDLVAQGTFIEDLASQVQTLDLSGAPRLGKAKAPLQIAVFGDLQSPQCARFFSVIKLLTTRYPDAVAVSFLHLPLGENLYARPSASWAVCAHEQGKFWQFAAEIYANQSVLPDALAYAAHSVGLKQAPLERCLASDRPATLIDGHLALAKHLQLSDAPSIFIQGRRWTSTRGYGIDALVATLKKHFPGIIR